MKAGKWITLSVLLMLSPVLWAHGGEDHGDAAQIAPHGQQAQRLADGRVLLPKGTQYRLGIRTQMAASSVAAQSIELNGHIVMDPNRGARIQASVGGRIEAPAGGLPLLGSRIYKGQLLAWVKPTQSGYEAAQQQADLAETRNKIKLAQLNVARLESLAGSVPQKDIQAAASELVVLQARAKALSGAHQGEALRASVDGVLASSAVIQGQVVESGTVLFEVVDPKGMLIEALAYDPALISNIASASLQGVSLRYLGGASALRDGALPLLFAPTEPLPLALGQVVKIVAQTRTQRQGIVLPASSVVNNAANESIVWLHEQALIFRAVPVKTQPLDGRNVLITSPLKNGSRVVTQGAALINQIR